MVRFSWFLGCLLLVGCSIEMVVIRGEWNGIPLVSIRQGSLESVKQACQNPEAAGCAITVNVDGIWYSHYEMAYEVFEYSMRQLEGWAHEQCHTMAQINKIPDPCHKENMGNLVH